MNLFEKIYQFKWQEYEKNPLINPPFPSPVIADPTFLPPQEAPDKKWHLFAHSLLGIHHFISSDGIKWKKLKGIVITKSLRPYLFKEKNLFYIFYEKILSFIPFQSRIEVRISEDLYRWGKPYLILSPSLLWHKRNCGNPCLIKDEKEYKLYYSAGLVYLKDCKFSEPKYIGVATSQNILGPYKFIEEPVISPDKNDPYRNLGAGAIKIIKDKNGYIGFENGIYIDEENRSRSAIRIIISKDGYSWSGFDKEPILKPGEGWKKAFVYALDVRKIENKLWLYFNARNGWLSGKESIGLCIGYLI